MQEKELKQVLTGSYDFSKWHRVIDYVFPNCSFENSIVVIENNNDKISYIHQKGEITLTDNKRIIILEVAVKKGNITKAKVGFHNLTAKFIDQANNHGILAFYIPDAEDKSDFRLSFISKESRFKEDGTYEEFKTNPKRYTYVLGENESATTAAKRLKELAAKKNGFYFELKDVIDAFSVEKLTEEFFKKYKEQFQIFNNHLIEDDNIRYNIFGIDRNETEDEKTINELPIRDFTKKLLGRLVFLYFLQRKGWMGVPKEKNLSAQPESTESDDYTKTVKRIFSPANGYKDFIFRLFKDSKHPESFHSKYLKELFYNTLNNKERPNFEFLIDTRSPFNDGSVRSVPYLNGGLFDNDFPPGNDIDFPAQMFEDLFEFLEQYNFTIDENSPEDHEVGIDPEMLGHIFENLLEENRNSGTYYTPKEVVHYMSQQTIIQYLCHHMPGNDKAIESLVKDDKEKITPFIESHAGTIKKLLHCIKVCDPAIGSGAFPMGILKVIYGIFCKLHNYLDPETPFDEAQTKKDIIQKSIYGVDLERGAVDIARLRFWLALVVDEDYPKPLPNLDYKIMQGHSLLEKFEGIPLVFNISEYKQRKGINRNLFGSMVEESSITTYLWQNQDFDITELEEKYFKSFDPQEKIVIKAKIETLEKEFIKEQVEEKRGKIQNEINKLTAKITEIQLTNFSDTFNTTIAHKRKLEKLKKGLEKYQSQREALINEKERLWQSYENLISNFHKNKPYFLWHLYFMDVFETGGFDIVIGNPPYIKEYTNRTAFDGLRDSPYYMGKMDIWYLFACFCMDMLKDNSGIECFIAQNNWITSAGAAILRNKVVQETEMLSFTDFGNYRVFQSAGIQTMIYVVKKTKQPAASYITHYSRLLVDNIDKTFLDYFLQSEKDGKHDNFEKLLFDFVPANYVNGYITFASDANENILKKIQAVNHIKLFENEVAQGIVFPQDFLNKKNATKLGGSFKVGQGIFALSVAELNNISLTKKEHELIKPYFTTDKFSRFYGSTDYEQVVIYTDSSFKNPQALDEYPNIKQHLDQFISVFTSDNKPYGLHRAREERFFIGEKIIVQRKCAGRPIFTYADFDTYVSATFYLIKTDRVNLKFLTALLNSKLIAFWLRHKGKMQGNNYQVDKEPLLEIPIIETDKQDVFANLVDYILLVYQPRQESLIKYIGDDLIINSIEEVIDHAFYELYFGNEPEMQELRIIEHLENRVQPITNQYTQKDIETVVGFYHWLHEQKNPIRNILLKANIVSKNIVGVINSTISQ
ncbi:MAG TPA: N-6 DNA methylase [Bacteroidales bacterium]|nr:N-6 DNA methylase [Bacteroidales bacterium]HSA42344.1 N-6 DNA methylase [Bacteroidales bacterium]